MEPPPNDPPSTASGSTDAAGETAPISATFESAGSHALRVLSKRRRDIGLALVALLIAWFAWQIRAVINPLLLGYLMAYILRPAVSRLERAGVGHTLAVSTIFVSASAVTILLVAVMALEASSLVADSLGPADVATQSSEQAQVSTDEEFAAEDTGESVAKAEAAPVDGLAPDGDTAVADGATEPNSDQDPETTQRPSETPKGRWEWARQQLGHLMGSDYDGRIPTSAELLRRARLILAENDDATSMVGDAGLQAVQILWLWVRRLFDTVFGVANLAFLVPIYAFFLLFEIEAIHTWVRGHLPTSRRAQLEDTAQRIGEIVSNFLRGRLLIAVLKGLLLTLALWIAQVPYPFLVGFLGGLLSLLPFIGGMIGFVLAAFAASLSYGWLPALLIAGAIFGAAELIEGYVLVPRILGSSLGLSEVAVLFAVTAGGAAFGLLGVLIALPVAATLKVLFVEFVEPALTDWARGVDAT